MLIYITNRKLCSTDFLQRIERLAAGKPGAIMLREKDLSSDVYAALALKVHDICQRAQVPFIVNQNIDVALKHQLPNVHLSMENLRIATKKLSSFTKIGASVHSVDEAKEAEKLGANYLIAGHIYRTNSKKGVPPRGLSFLKDVCHSVSIPVFAIGGITSKTYKEVLSTGASGACIMSTAMIDPSPEELPCHFQSTLNS